MIVAGIDIGHLNMKTMILHNGEVKASSQCSTSEADDEANLVSLLDRTADKCDTSLNEIDQIVVTGAMAKALSFSHKRKSLVACIVKGATARFTELRTLIDLGAESFTIIKLNGMGRALNFINNDTCAAGTGIFLDTIAKAMRLSTEEMGSVSLQASEIAPISSMCAVFAESEVISLVHRGVSRSSIIAGLHKALAERIVAAAKRLGIQEKIAITGGVAKNTGCIREIEDQLGLPITVPEQPEMIAAYGAALIAAKLASTT